MVLLVRKDIFDELSEQYFEKSTSHRKEKVRKLVQIHRNKGKDYQAYRWVNIMSGDMPRIDNKYKATDSKAKAQYNSKIIVNKDFRDLTPEEVKKFVEDAKNKFYYYNSKGVHVAYGNEKGKDKEKYNKELNDCKILVGAGHEVYWLPEHYAMDSNGSKVHGDTITDNIPLELKDTNKNTKGSYKEGRKQAIDVFIRIINPMTTSYATTSITKYINAVKEQNKKEHNNFEGKVYLYFEKTKQLRLFVFNEQGEWKEEKAQKK